MLGGGNYLFHLPPTMGILIIHLATLFLVLFWSLKRIRMGRPIIPYVYIRGPIIPFILVNIFTLSYSVDPYNGHLKILILLNGIAFFIFVQSLPRERKDYIRIMRVIVLSGIFVSLYGLYQEFFGFSQAVREAMESSLPPHIISNIEAQVRIFSTFLNVNAFAGYLIIIIPLCLYLSMFAEERVIRLWSGISLPLILSALILTFSRGGWLIIIIISFIIMVYLAYNRLGRNLILFSYFASALVILLLLISIGLFGDIALLSGINIVTIIDSIGDRLEYWRMATRIIIEHPLAGAGLGGYALMAQRYQIGSVYSRYAHNNYLEIFAELGIFGFITYIWLIARVIQKGLSIIRKDGSNRHEGFFLMTAIIGFLIHTLIDFDWETPAIQITFFLLAGMITGMDRIDNKSIKEEEVITDIRPSLRRSALYLILTLLTSITMIGIISPFIADGYFRDAKEVSNGEDVEVALDLGRHAVKFAPYSGRYHNLLAILMRRKGDITKDLSWYHLSLAESEKAISYEPVNALYHNEKAKTLWVSDNHSDSISEFIKAKDLHPADISIRNDLGAALVMTSRYDGAIKELEDTILIGDDYLNRHHPDLGFILNTYLLLGEAYKGVGKLDKSLHRYEKVLQILPMVPSLFDRKGNLIKKNILAAEASFRKGEIYQLKGEKGLALQEFKRAYEMNRSLTDLPARIKELGGG